MSNEILKEEVVIENMIYEIRGKQVMLDSKLCVSKCHGYLYDKIVAHFDIGKPISMLINYRDASLELERN